MSLVDFENERAARRGPWTRWAEAPPADDVVVRLRGDVRLAGEAVAMTLSGRYCRRGQALCSIGADGSLRLVRPPYDQIEWTPA